MFLLKRLFEITDTKAPIHKSTVALKQKDPTIQASIKIPQISPTIALLIGLWKTENAVRMGITKSTVAPFIERFSESV